MSSASPKPESWRNSARPCSRRLDGHGGDIVALAHLCRERVRTARDSIAGFRNTVTSRASRSPPDKRARVVERDVEQKRQRQRERRASAPSARSPTAARRDGRGWRKSRRDDDRAMRRAACAAKAADAAARPREAAALAPARTLAPCARCVPPASCLSCGRPEIVDQAAVIEHEHALAMRLIRCRSWLAISTVVPTAPNSANRFMISAESCGSRLPVGSSAMITGGLATIARAMPTRCCSPADSVSGECFLAREQADLVERGAHALADFLARRAGNDQRQRDVVEHGAVGQQPVILEHHADAAPHAAERRGGARSRAACD